MTSAKLAIVGAGGWGTALAAVLSAPQRQIWLWARREALAAEVQRGRVNAAYLPGVVLPEQVSVTSDLHRAVEGADRRC